MPCYTELLLKGQVVALLNKLKAIRKHQTFLHTLALPSYMCQWYRKGSKLHKPPPTSAPTHHPPSGDGDNWMKP